MIVDRPSPSPTNCSGKPRRNVSGKAQSGGSGSNSKAQEDTDCHIQALREHWKLSMVGADLTSSGKPFQDEIHLGKKLRVKKFFCFERVSRLSLYKGASSDDALPEPVTI